MSLRAAARPPLLGLGLAGLCLAIVWLAAATPSAVAHPVTQALAQCPAAPLTATLKFQSGPANATFAPGTPIKLILQLQNTSGAEVLATDGFASSDFFRRLAFSGPKGLIINKSEETLHNVTQTLHCQSRKLVLQSPAIPVVPVEKLAATFFREYVLEAQTLYDLAVPGHYSVDARIELLTFLSGEPAVFADCDQFQGPPPVSLVTVDAIEGRCPHTVVSNTLQFVIAGPGTGGSLDRIAISPATSSIGAGGTEFYTAEGFDAANNSLGDVTSATTFSIEPNGSCAGPACTATTLGPHTVTGSISGKTATANLAVAPPTNVVKAWVGLANSDDLQIRFDLKAVVTKNGTQVGSGQLGSVNGGSSGFNNAVLDRIPIFSASGPLSVSPGDTLSVEVLVRNACANSNKLSGTARLWFDGAKIDTGATRDAGSRLDPPSGSSTLYFLRSGSLLSPTPGSPPPPAPTARTSVDTAVGGKCGPYQSFDTWSTTVPQ